MINFRCLLYLVLLTVTLCLVAACTPRGASSVSSSKPELAELETLAKQVKYNRNFSSVTYPLGNKNVSVGRLQKGLIATEVVDSIFSYFTRDTSETLEVLLINYYPAKTIYNATGTFGTSDLQRIYRALDQKIESFDRARSIYVVRPGASLDRYAKAATWVSDEFLFLERYFVPHPQLGSSYVVLDKLGNYELYLGEHSNATTIKSFTRISKPWLKAKADQR